MKNKLQSPVQILRLQTLLFLSFANDPQGRYHYRDFPSGYLRASSSEVNANRFTKNTDSILAQETALVQLSQHLNLSGQHIDRNLIETLIHASEAFWLNNRALSRYEDSLSKMRCTHIHIAPSHDDDTQIESLNAITTKEELAKYLDELGPEDTPFKSDVLFGFAKEGILKKITQRPVTKLKMMAKKRLELCRAIVSGPLFQDVVNGNSVDFVEEFEKKCINILKKECPEIINKVVSSTLYSKPTETVSNELQDEVLLKFYDELMTCVSNGTIPFLTKISTSAVKDFVKKVNANYVPLETVDYISGKSTQQSLDFLHIKCLLERYQLPTGTDLCTTIAACVTFFNNNLDTIEEWRDSNQKSKNRLYLLLAMVDGQIIDDNDTALTQEQMAALLGVSRRSFSDYVRQGRAMLKGVNNNR